MNTLHIWLIAKREVKLGFRNPWAYSFLSVYTIFSLILLLVQQQSNISGYTHTTATMLHLILYILPLMALLLGSFSVNAEKEEGSWSLLSTYALSTASFLWGKYIGLAIVLITILCFGYALSSLIGAVLGITLAGDLFFLFLSFSVLIILLFLGMAVVIGALAKNRWQALTYGVSLWFLFILGWPAILIAVLGFVPYLWVKPLLIGVTFLNPAELVRLFVVARMGGGAVFGVEYYQWVHWMEQSYGLWLFVFTCAVWIAVSVAAAQWIWERGRRRG